MFEYSSLYHEMGGKEVLTRLASRMYQYNAMDRRISHYFEIGMMGHFESMFVTFLTGLLGGQPYNRKSMIYCHQRIQLGDEHFDAFLENLTLAMRHEALPQSIIDRLLAMIETTREDVCGRSKPKPKLELPATSCPFKSEKAPSPPPQPKYEPTLCPCVIQ